MFQAFWEDSTTCLLILEFALAIEMKILLLFAKDCNGKRDLKGNAQNIEKLKTQNHFGNQEIGENTKNIIARGDKWSCGYSGVNTSFIQENRNEGTN